MFVYLIPVFSSLIGWFTNFIAIKLLFHPQEIVHIGPIKIQGIFPKRQAEIAEKLGTIVASELLSSTDLKNEILKEDNLSNIYEKIENKILDYLNVKLPRRFAIFSVLINDRIKSRIVNEAMTEIRELGPNVFHLFLNDLENNFDISKTIKEKVNNFEPKRLEDMLKGLMKKEFTFIEWVGAILGFLIGCVQLLILYFQGLLPSIETLF